MLFYTVGQSQIFIAMLYAGLFIGAWYHVLRLVRHLLEAGMILTSIMDILFGVGAGVVLIGFLLQANYMDLRLYALLGALCGMILYACTIGPFLTWMGKLCESGTRKVIRMLMNTAVLKNFFK